jgi:hypothetical protein
MALGFITKLKSTAVIVGVASAVSFGAGWSVNGWRLEAKFAEAQIAAIEEWKNQQAILIEKHTAQVKRDTTARIALSATISESRAKTRQLQESLKRATLAKPKPEILTIQGECNAQIDFNPISDQFVSLWNSSARGVTAD